MTKKIFFRGDDRHPHHDNIFKDGFLKRTPGTSITYRQPQWWRSGDIEPNTAVCVSARFAAAAMFPLKFNNTEPRIDTYIYAVCLDVERVFNTHARQVTDSLVSPALAQMPGRVMWPLFGHELAANRIHPGEIIAAVPCRRHWNGADWQQGGTYTLLPLVRNLNCGAPQIWVASALDFLRREIDLAKDPMGAHPLPRGDSGYHASTGR